MQNSRRYNRLLQRNAYIPHRKWDSTFALHFILSSDGNGSGYDGRDEALLPVAWRLSVAVECETLFALCRFYPFSFGAILTMAMELFMCISHGDGSHEVFSILAQRIHHG